MPSLEVLIEILSRLEKKVDDGFARINGTIGHLESRLTGLEQFKIEMNTRYALQSKFEDHEEARHEAKKDNLIYPFLVSIGAFIFGVIFTHFFHF